MDTSELTDFSGISGRVLRGSSSFGALITGIVLAVVIGGGGYALINAQSFDAILPFVQIVLVVALARFAVNGLHGDFGSLAGAATGGSWTDVLLVSLRFALLTVLWFVPLQLAGLDGQSVAATILGSAMGFAPKGAMLLITLYMLGTLVTPVVFLIVAVSAEGFGDMFTATHWRRVFGGRLGDLYHILALSLGALTFLSMIVMPLAAALANVNPDLGKIVTFGGVAFLLGVWVTLMGRLCGFFASGETGDALPSTAPTARIPVPATGAVTAREPSAPAAGPPPPPARASIPVSGAAATGAGKTTALDEARRLFEQDPQAAIASLEQLRGSPAGQQPDLLHALCRMHLQTGNVDSSIDVGREALEACQSAHRRDLLAELARELWPHVDRLQPSREQVLVWGRVLAEREDLASAARAFARLVREQPEDVRPIKGLLKIANAMLHEKGRPAEAIKVHTFLLQACPESPLVEHFRRGLEEARRAA